MIDEVSFDVTLIITLTLLLTGLRVWRKFDIRDEDNLWRCLEDRDTRTESTQLCFHINMLKDLPEPAKRYFRYTISPNTPLKKIASIDMNGEFGLGTKTKPKYRPMQAKQILAPPYGLVWKFCSGIITGSDSASDDLSWTRVWLFGVIPLIRVAGETDHRRSAFGRVVAESVFWVPAALLPSSNVRWESLDHESARAVVTYGEFEQTVDVTVATNGQPTKVVINRWSNANKEKKYRLQPFGGYPSDFKRFDGYRLATCVEGGNHIDTPEYFPFYKVSVKSVQFCSTKK